LQREKRMKRYNTLLFSVKEEGLETRKLRKLFGQRKKKKKFKKIVRVM